MTEIQVHGHTATYPVAMDDQEEIYMWLRKNPHRLHLGKLSFLIDGHQINPDHLSAMHQQLNLWRGVIYSNYRLMGIPVTVITTCHPAQDALAVRIQSPPIEEKRLSVHIAFPYGNPNNTSGADYNAPGKHATELSLNTKHARFSRTLDRDDYSVQLGWDEAAKLEEVTRHCYILMPSGETDTFSFVCHFAAEAINCAPFDFEQTLEAATEHWEESWQTGGAVDLSGSTDARWQDVVFQTAEFMASYAHKNEETGKYDLGPWLINAAENNAYTKESTANPAFELAYWRYGLATACRWSERLGLPTDKKWLEVLQSLAPLPVEDGLYVMYEGIPDMWDRFNHSHIDVIGAGAFLPASGLDMHVLNSTINKVLDAWRMEST